MAKTKRKPIQTLLAQINYEAVGDLPTEDNSFYLLLAPLFPECDGLPPEKQITVLRGKILTFVSDNESAFTKVSLFLCTIFVHVTFHESNLRH